MTPGGVDWAYLTVREDLDAEIGHLRVLAGHLHDEAVSSKHPNLAVRQHLAWASEQVTGWADEAALSRDTGDGLDHRTALDAALWRRRIAGEFLRAWRGPLGDLWNDHRATD